MTYLLESVLIALILIFVYYKRTVLNILNWKFSLKLSKELISKSWMIMLGSFFAIIYLKSDQIMLKWMIGDSEVGIYSVASLLSEVWYFLPAIIVTSLFPKIIEYKENNIKQYYKRLQQLMDLLFVVALIIAIIISLIATNVITLLYGNAYADSGIILSIHIWAGLFIFMREVFSKWIIVENLLQFSIITHGLGMIFNIILNLILIPEYGAVGAAIATIISYSIASYFSLLFFKKTRIIFFMMTKAMLSPFHYLFRITLK
jgi:O-antigen/teichoic acid export membrane protein